MIEPPAGQDGEEDHRKLQYDSYCSQRAHLCAASLEVSGRYDQLITTLAGGALVLSIGFLEKIAPHPHANTKHLIGLAWASLIPSLVCGASSILASQYAIDRQLGILDKENLPSEAKSSQEKKDKNRLVSFVHGLNVLSIITFVAGIIFLCLFAFKNLPPPPIPAPTISPQLPVQVPPPTRSSTVSP